MVSTKVSSSLIPHESRLHVLQVTAHPVTGTHDSFRHGLTSTAQGVAAGNISPLQARLEKVS